VRRQEYYFYLDSTPTHSYMKYLYKYPEAAFPYGDLVDTSRSRDRHEFEYELLDTGAFDRDRYFDVFVQYAAAAPEDILIRTFLTIGRIRSTRLPAGRLLPPTAPKARVVKPPSHLLCPPFGDKGNNGKSGWGLAGLPFRRDVVD